MDSLRSMLHIAQTWQQADLLMGCVMEASEQLLKGSGEAVEVSIREIGKQEGGERLRLGLHLCRGVFASLGEGNQRRPAIRGVRAPSHEPGGFQGIY